MPFTTKIVQVGWNSSRLLSTTSGCSRSVFGSSGGAQDKFRDHQGTDRETVDTKNTANKVNMKSAKDEIKVGGKEEMSRTKQDRRGKISNSWKQFE